MAVTMTRQRETTANVSSSRLERDVATKILYWEPEAAPFTLLSAAVGGKRTATSYKPEWIEKQLRPAWDQINNSGGYTSGDTAVVVDNPTYWLPGDIINIPRTGEKVRVTAVDTGTSTLTVVRGVGSTSAAALLDNDDLQRLGSAYAEGAGVGTEISVQEDFKYNYTQIHRSPFGATGTEMAMNNYGNQGSRATLRAEHAIYHKIALERAMLFGERNRVTTDTNAPRGYAGGFLYYVTTTATNINGSLSEADVWTFAQAVFARTSSGDTRTLFTSPLVSTVVDLLAGARLETVPADRTYGISTKQWVTSHGTFMVVKHRLLEMGVSGNYGYGGYALAVDPTRLKYVTLEGRDTKLLIDRQSPGDDAWTDEYLTECSLELDIESAHGYMYGITG